MISMNWNEIKSWLKMLPKWLRYTIIIVVCVLASLLAIVVTESCSTIRVSQTSNGEVRVSSSQSTLDSTKIEINLLNRKNNGE